MFGTKFAEEKYFCSKKKVNITIEFSILELVQITNFSLNWFFRQNLSKNGFSRLKEKEWTPTPYSNFSWYQISALTENFDFLDKIWQKEYFWSKTGKVNITIVFYIFWTKVGYKRCFWSKTEKVNSTIDLPLFELA